MVSLSAGCWPGGESWTEPGSRSRGTSTRPEARQATPVASDATANGSGPEPSGSRLHRRNHHRWFASGGQGPRIASAIGCLVTTTAEPISGRNGLWINFFQKPLLASACGIQTPRACPAETCRRVRRGVNRQGRGKRRRRNEAGVEPRDEESDPARSGTRAPPRRCALHGTEPCRLPGEGLGPDRGCRSGQLTRSGRHHFR